MNNIFWKKFLKEQSDHFRKLADQDLKEANKWLWILLGAVGFLFYFCLQCF